MNFIDKILNKYIKNILVNKVFLKYNKIFTFILYLIIQIKLNSFLIKIFILILFSFNNILPLICISLLIILQNYLFNFINYQNLSGNSLRRVKAIDDVATGKALYAGDFQLVFELCQLLKSIDMNSWHSSKTSWK